MSAGSIESRLEALERTVGELCRRNATNPWAAAVGSLPDDAVTAAWLAAVEEYRQERDEPGFGGEDASS